MKYYNSIIDSKNFPKSHPYTQSSAITVSVVLWEYEVWGAEEDGKEKSWLEDSSSSSSLIVYVSLSFVDG